MGKKYTSQKNLIKKTKEDKELSFGKKNFLRSQRLLTKVHNVKKIFKKKLENSKLRNSYKKKESENKNKCNKIEKSKILHKKKNNVVKKEEKKNIIKEELNIIKEKDEINKLKEIEKINKIKEIKIQKILNEKNLNEIIEEEEKIEEKLKKKRVKFKESKIKNTDLKSVIKKKAILKSKSEKKISLKKDIKIEFEDLYQTIENNLDKDISKNITFQMLNKKNINYKSLKIIENPSNFKEEDKDENLKINFKEKINEFLLNINNLDLERKNAILNQRKNSKEKQIFENGKNLLTNKKKLFSFDKKKKFNLSYQNSKKSASQNSFDIEKLDSCSDNDSELFINSQDLNLIEKKNITRKTLKYNIETPRDLMSLQSYSNSISHKSDN